MHTLNNLFIYGQVFPRDFNLDKKLKILQEDLLSPNCDRGFYQAASERLGIVWPTEKVLLSREWDTDSGSTGNVWYMFIAFLLLLKQVSVWLKMIGANVMLEFSSPTTRSSKCLLNHRTRFGRGHCKILPSSPFHLWIGFQFIWPSKISIDQVHIVKAMVFPVVNVPMWKMDRKEGWVPKNWCFQIVVLEKTPESPLDCKEMKTVSPKGNRPWIFTGRTDAEAEAPTLWPLIGEDPDAGKDWKQKEKAGQKMRWFHSSIDSVKVNLSKLKESIKEGELARCSPETCKESDPTEWLSSNSRISKFS